MTVGAAPNDVQAQSPKLNFVGADLERMMTDGIAVSQLLRHHHAPSA